MNDTDFDTIGIDKTDSGSTPPATVPAPPLVNPFTLFRQRNSGGGGFFRGDLLKCDYRTGEWLRVRGENETQVDTDERFIVNPHEMVDTWAKFATGKLVDRKIYRTIDGEMAPERAELGDNDEDAWPSRNGKAKDPWQRAVYLPMKDSGGEVVAFKATSNSAIGEIGELVGMYGSADRHGKFPVVELQTRNFESQHGNTIYVPVFRLVDWEFWEPDTPAPDVQPVPLPPPKPALATRKAGIDTNDDDVSDIAPLGKAKPRGDMDDEIPF
jgi:hypothetical protein